MCPTADKLTGEMVGVETNPGQAPQAIPISTNGNHTAQPLARSPQQQRNPYAPRYSDFLSNVCNFKIIESTLRGK